MFTGFREVCDINFPIEKKTAYAQFNSKIYRTKNCILIELRSANRICRVSPKNEIPHFYNAWYLPK